MGEIMFFVSDDSRCIDVASGVAAASSGLAALAACGDINNALLLGADGCTTCCDRLPTFASCGSDIWMVGLSSPPA